MNAAEFNAYYAALPPGPCGWKYCGKYGCIVKGDADHPCEAARALEEEQK